MASVELVVEGDVYKALSPNLRIHYYERYRRAQSWKLRTRLAWKQAGCPQFPGKVRLTITLRRGRSVDPDNAVAAMQPVINSLKSEPGIAGLFVDDSPKWLELAPIVQETGPRWRGREEVLIHCEDHR